MLALAGGALRASLGPPALAAGAAVLQRGYATTVKVEGDVLTAEVRLWGRRATRQHQRRLGQRRRRQAAGLRAAIGASAAQAALPLTRMPTLHHAAPGGQPKPAANARGGSPGSVR